MGNTQTPIRTNRSSTDSIGPAVGSSRKGLKEHKRHGVVALKIHTINSRNTEDWVSHVLTPRGALLYGSSFNAGVTVKAMEDANYPLILPTEVVVPDSRAHKLLVTYCQGWQLIPFPEIFSRHSGTCVIVGDRNMNSISYPIRVGDCFRLGSVGVVVSELKLEGREEQRLDARTLEFLKDEALAFDTCEELAALASDEIDSDGCDCDRSRHSADDQTVPNYQSGLTNGEKFICYMCYETHNTNEDPLIAPCECKGDTRFLHVQCLQKWYYSSAHGARAQVIRTTGNGAPACKICGTAYKTNFRRPQDGKKASILEMENNGPYLSLVVVTHHDTNPGLFNTKFRLNFGRQANAPSNLTDDELNTIVIGRSSSCAMILDYRTVSTIHAKITYTDGRFELADNRSSNGTMVYLQHPFPLPYSQPVKVRMGRTTLTFQAKRTLTAAVRAYLVSPWPRSNTVADISQVDRDIDMNTPSPQVVHQLLTNLPSLPTEKNERNEAPAENEFMNVRSYTIRTLNDPTAEADFDPDLYPAGLGQAGGNMSNLTLNSINSSLQSNLQAIQSMNAMNSRLYGNFVMSAQPNTSPAAIAEINNNMMMLTSGMMSTSLGAGAGNASGTQLSPGRMTVEEQRAARVMETVPEVPSVPCSRRASIVHHLSEEAGDDEKLMHSTTVAMGSTQLFLEGQGDDDQVPPSEGQSAVWQTTSVRSAPSRSHKSTIVMAPSPDGLTPTAAPGMMMPIGFPSPNLGAGLADSEHTSEDLFARPATANAFAGVLHPGPVAAPGLGSSSKEAPIGEHEDEPTGFADLSRQG